MTRDAATASAIRGTPLREGRVLEVLDLDVTDHQSVTRAIEAALARTNGRIDIVINTGGIGTSGPLELHSPEALRAQFEANVIGPHRVPRGVAPAMRARQAGLILQISCGLGRIVNTLIGSCCATKWGVEGLSESLRQELAPFNVGCAHH